MSVKSRKIDQFLGFRILNMYKDSTFDFVDIFVDDDVEEFKYIENEELKSVSGRVTDIGYLSKTLNNKKSIKEFAPLKDFFKVDEIAVDNSTQYNASIVFIKAKDIIEYNADDSKEINKVCVRPLIKESVTLNLDDGTTSSIDFVDNLTVVGLKFMDNGEEIEGTFKVIGYMFKYDEMFERDMVVGVILTRDERTYSVRFNNITFCGLEAMVEDVDADVAADITAAYETQDVVAVALKKGEYTEFSALNLKKTTTISGAKAGISAAKGDRCTNEIKPDETVVSTSVVTTDADVLVLDGLAFTRDSFVNVKNVDEVVFKNCKFCDINPAQVLSGNKSYMFYSPTPDIIKIAVEDCYFGKSLELDGGASTYNYFELNCKMADGSYIKNCYFHKEVGVHNIINVYDVDNTGGLVPSIYIQNNHFEYSGNAIRIGTKGDAYANFYISDNVWDDNYEEEDYEGLLLVQPYGQSTTDMKHLNIYLDRNVCTSKADAQLYYCYFAGTSLTDENKPNVYVNTL